MIVTAGKTNVSVYFYFVDDVSGTNTGEPTTGLLFSDIETGGSGSYVRQGAARVDITLITLASASAAHADGGFILVDDTNMKGLYRLDVPDAAFVTGVDQVIIDLVAASGKNTVTRPIVIDITDVDLRDSVRGGMTALPNAAADAGGGLPISDAGGLALDVKLANTNEITVARMGALTDWINAGRLDAILDLIKAAVDSVKTSTDGLSGAAMRGTDSVDTATMRGTDNAALASVVGALADAAAAGDPTSADTLMQYLKQLVNVLVGAVGVGTWPTEQAPGNGINLFEVIRAMHVDSAGLNGAVMRGTDGANTTTPNTVTPLNAAGVRSALGMASADLDTQLDGKATPTNITAGILTTVTNLTNLPSIPANWLTAAGINDNAFTAAKFAANFLTAAKINADAFTAAKFAANWLEAAGIVASALNGKGDWNTTTPNTVTPLDAAGVRTALGMASADLDTQLDGKATPTNIVAGTIATVSNAIVLPSIPANWLAASGLAADAVNKIRDGLLPTQNAVFAFDFLMVDSTDHVTPEPSLTITVTRSIDGAAYASGTGTLNEIANGTYEYVSSTADQNGAKITYRFTASGADDKFITVYTGGAV